jgi:CDP-glucose 4,6-dehydratase
MVRDFIFSEDVSKLYMLIAQELALNPKKLKGQIFNAGSNDPIDIKSLIIKVYTTLGNSKDLELILNKMKGKKTKGEIHYQHMSFDKVYNYFNWKPLNSIDDGIKKSITWYKKIFNN